MGIKHTTQTAKPNNPDYDVSADAWNEDHTIDGDVDLGVNHRLLTRAGAASFAVITTAIANYGHIGTSAAPFENVFGKYLSAMDWIFTNEIKERLAASGVTVDGVLCKDGVVPDSAYPNAILKDGSRAMIDDFDLAGNSLLTTNLLFKEYSASTFIVKNRADTALRDIWVRSVTCDSLCKPYVIRAYSGAHDLPIQDGGSVEVAKVDSTNDLFEISRAGDITGLAGKTIDFPAYKVSGVAGVDGSFTTADGKTVTVTKGIITSIV